MDRQGHYRTIGRGERAYRSFVPTPLQDIHLEIDEEMQTLLAQAHDRLKNRNLSDIDALQKEEVENSVNLVYGEKKPISLAFFETDDKEDKKRKLDERNLLQATRFAVERMQKLPISSRLLTLLFLMDRSVIQQPVLSLSKNLMSSSFKYFTGIASVEVSGTYEKWVKYFLKQLH